MSHSGPGFNLCRYLGLALASVLGSVLGAFGCRGIPLSASASVLRSRAVPLDFATICLQPDGVRVGSLTDGQSRSLPRVPKLHASCLPGNRPRSECDPIGCTVSAPSSPERAFGCRNKACSRLPLTMASQCSARGYGWGAPTSARKRVGKSTPGLGTPG
jgi:hypothetical protein